LSGLIVAVRLKGHIGLHPDVRKTLQMLNLKRTNYAVIVPDTPSTRGMLRKVAPYITWGTPNKQTVITLLKKMEIRGDGRLGEQHLEKLGVKTVEELAEKLINNPTQIKQLKEKLNIRPYIRLHPPRKGFKRSIKRPYKDKGEWGDRGEAINDLIRRMA